MNHSSAQAVKEIGWAEVRTHLEDHDPGVPALRFRLVDTLTECSRVHDAGRRIAWGRLANDELVQVDAVGCDLEDGRAGEGTARSVDQALAVGVLRFTLVVELDVVL